MTFWVFTPNYSHYPSIRIEKGYKDMRWPVRYECILSYVLAMGTVWAQTELNRKPWFNDLLFPKKNGLVWFGFSINGSVRF